MSTRRLILLGIVCALQGPSFSNAVELSLVPVRASGAHTLIGGNGLYIASGGQFLIFEIYVSNWDPDGDGEPLLETIQAATNGGSYGGPSSPEDLAFFNPVCSTDADCTAAFGVPGAPCRNANNLLPSPCAGAKCCEAAFMDRNHPDFLGAGLQTVSGAEQLSLRWGVTINDGSVMGFTDDGLPKYMGTLVLSAPPTIVGAFTLTFRTPECFYWLEETPNQIPQNINPSETTPAQAFVNVTPIIDFPEKNRYILYPMPVLNLGPTDIQVTLVSLHHPTRPTPTCSYQPADFSALEGETRYVGPPTLYRMSDADPNHLFWAARLQCEPYTRDWGDVSALLIYGPEIVPDSEYSIVGPAIGGLFRTGRWADMVPPFEREAPGSQPDFGDISAMLERFRNAFGAPSKAQAQLQPAIPDPSRKVNFADIANAVAAFHGCGYPFAAPTPCP